MITTMCHYLGKPTARVLFMVLCVFSLLPAARTHAESTVLHSQGESVSVIQTSDVNGYTIANNFTIPTATAWTIEQAGYAFHIASTYANVPVTISVYRNNEGVPGTLIYQEADLAASVDGNYLVYTLPSPLALGPGSYWIGQSTNQTYRVRTYPAADGVGQAYRTSTTHPWGKEGREVIFRLSGTSISDTTPPLISCGSADDAWHGSDASIACTASDSGSGLANGADASFSLSTSVAAGSEDANASTNSREVCDIATNCATAGPISGNKVDKKAPSTTITAPTNNATYVLNQGITASYSCTDGGAGVASCAGPVADGSNIDTASTGTKTFTVNASDNVGNSDTPSVSYRVGYDFHGFSSPVDNNGVVNSAKAGQTIPLKWRLLDAAGTPVTNLSSAQVTVQSFACALGSAVDQLEEYATGSSGFQNLGDGYYQFNWKTPTSYAKSCKTVHLDLGEGATRTALFQFVK